MYRDGPPLAIDPQARRVSLALWSIAGALLAQTTLAVLGALVRLDGGPVESISDAAWGALLAVRWGQFIAVVVELVALTTISRAEISRSARAAARCAWVVIVVQEISAVIAFVPLGLNHDSSDVGSPWFGPPLAPALSLAVPIALVVVASRLASSAPRIVRTVAIAAVMATVAISLIPQSTIPEGPEFSMLLRAAGWLQLAALVSIYSLAARSLRRSAALPPPVAPTTRDLALRRATSLLALALVILAAATGSALGGVAQLVIARSSRAGMAEQLCLVPLLQLFASVLMILGASRVRANVTPPASTVAGAARSLAIVALVVAVALCVFVYKTFGGGVDTGDIATALYGLFSVVPIAAAWQLARSTRLASASDSAGAPGRIVIGLAGQALASIAVVALAFLSLHADRSDASAAGGVYLVTLIATAAGLLGATVVTSAIDAPPGPVA